MSCKGCPIACPGNYETHELISEDTSSADGVWIKSMGIPLKGTLVPQHAHVYDHTSFLAKGSVRAWAGNGDPVDYVAPFPIFIKAGVKHTFESLEPDTLILCIHNTLRTGSIEVLEEHQFGDT